MDRNTFEIHKRRQIYNRINELKINCELLRQTKDSLVGKLKELNETADRLIAEKDEVKTDLFGSKFLHSTYQNRDLPHEMPQFSSRLATDDPNDFRSKFSSSSSRRNEQEAAIPLTGQPSDAFKMKISFCLHELMQKGGEIAELSERLSKTGSSYGENRKQQKTH